MQELAIPESIKNYLSMGERNFSNLRSSDIDLVTVSDPTLLGEGGKHGRKYSKCIESVKLHAQ